MDEYIVLLVSWDGVRDTDTNVGSFSSMEDARDFILGEDWSGRTKGSDRLEICKVQGGRVPKQEIYQVRENGNIELVWERR